MGPSRVIEGLRHPSKSIQYSKSVLKGYYYKIIYRLFNRSVKIGKQFRVTGRLIIKGPGKVIIGHNVLLSDRVTPWTYSKEAEIIIGSNVFLNGTRFGCRNRIEVGDGCILADCRVLDTDFHSVYPGRRNDPRFINSEPIKICKNVWITMGCVILKGVTINNGTTIMPNSVVFNDVPEYCLYGGNPASLIKSISEDLAIK
jgi:acetyltransferase-like isoleucine patch superfamily enzyme